MPRKHTDTSRASEFTPTEARTADARESSIVSAAYDLAEQRIREGTASDTLISQFIKYGSRQSRLELEIAELQKDLMVAKTKAYESTQRSDDLYRKAIEQLKIYSGGDEEEF